MASDLDNGVSEQEQQPFSATSALEELLIRELPAQYSLLAKISQGGMGAIYKAKNRYTGSLVAIKVMLLERARKSDKAMQRFIVEAKAASSLKHPLICPVYDFGITESHVPYLIMDWINGLPLGKKVVRDTRLPITEALDIFEQVATALAYMHKNKIVHRDMKPDNIMLSRDAHGAPKVHLVDFGIAKVLQSDEQESTQALQLTSDGQVVGTPLFMSPEQARGLADLDGRSDIYSLACVMYFALTGEPPFAGPTVVDTIAKHLHQPPREFPTRLQIPPALRLLIFKCLEKKPEDRYQTVDEILVDLRKVMQGGNIKQKSLTQDKERSRKQLKAVIFFILGFVIMSAISMALQNVLDKPREKTVSNGTATSTTAGGRSVDAKIRTKR